MIVVKEFATEYFGWNAVMLEVFLDDDAWAVIPKEYVEDMSRRICIVRNYGKMACTHRTLGFSVSERRLKLRPRS